MNRSRTGKATPMLLGVVCGALFSCLITTVGISVLSWAIINGGVREEAVGYYLMAAILLSSALGALVAKNLSKRRLLFSCLLTGGLYFLILLGVTAVMFGGQYQGVGVTGLLILCGSCCVAWMGGKKKKQAIKQRKKYCNR